MTTHWRGALVALSASVALGCGARKAADEGIKSTEPKPVTVTVAPAERRAVERTVDVVGTLKGWEEVTVGAKRMGRVARVLHDIGDRVKPGEPLVELDPIDEEAAILHAQETLLSQLEQLGLHALPETGLDESKVATLDQARAAIGRVRKEFSVEHVPSVVQARVALDKAKQNFSRERALRQRGAGTPQDYQNAELDERAAEAALANAEVNARVLLANAIVGKVAVEISRTQRADMTIRAPTVGRTRPDSSAPVVFAVSKRTATEGQMLKQGEAVADLVIEDPLRLWTSVPESFAADVKEGQEVRLSVAAFPGRTFFGKVARINPSVESASRTFQVETSVPNKEGLLRPGGFAKASIVVQRDDAATTVPLESVVRSVGVTKLFVVEGSKARAIPIETGLEGKGWVEVIGAVPPKAMVVTTGQSALADGSTVVVRDPKAEATAPQPAAKTAGAESSAGPRG